MDREGLPIGMQLIGDCFQEKTRSSVQRHAFEADRGAIADCHARKEAK